MESRTFPVFLALVSILFAGEANAQCAPDAPNPGDTVTCNGVDNDGFFSAADDVTVDVLAGSEVAFLSPSVVDVMGLGDNVDLNVSGLIDGTRSTFQFQNAVRMGALGEVTVSESGEIRAFRDGVFLSGEITNRGTISAGDRAVSGGDVVVNNFGLIKGDDRAVNGSDVRVVNSGEISAGDWAVVGSSSVFINNKAPGTITAQDRIAVGGPITIVNEGTLSADSWLAASASDSITIENTGDMSAGDRIANLGQGTILLNNSGSIDAGGWALRTFGGGVDLENSGDLTSDLAVISVGNFSQTEGGDANVDVVNSGLIEARNDIAIRALNNTDDVVVNSGVIRGVAKSVELAGGVDTVTLLDGGVFDGIVDLGDDNDLLQIFTDAAGQAGGASSYFDGGLGLDEIEFNISVADIIDFDNASLDEYFTLSFLNSVNEISFVKFQEFERFAFADGRFSSADLASLVSEVPVPGAAFLFLSALGFCGLSQKRKCRR